jgi:hypothetical protein
LFAVKLHLSNPAGVINQNTKPFKQTVEVHFPTGIQQTNQFSPMHYAFVAPSGFDKVLRLHGMLFARSQKPMRALRAR